MIVRLEILGQYNLGQLRFRGENAPVNEHKIDRVEMLEILRLQLVNKEQIVSNGIGGNANASLKSRKEGTSTFIASSLNVRDWVTFCNAMDDGPLKDLTEASKLYVKEYSFRNVIMFVMQSIPWQLYIIPIGFIYLTVVTRDTSKPFTCPTLIWVIQLVTLLLSCWVTPKHPGAGVALKRYAAIHNAHCLCESYSRNGCTRYELVEELWAEQDLTERMRQTNTFPVHWEYCITCPHNRSKKHFIKISWEVPDFSV